MTWPARSDRQVLLLALAAGLPGTAAALALAWALPAPPWLRWGLSLLLPTVWIAGAQALRHRFTRPVQTIANLIGALRIGDYSVRARGARADDPLGLARLELNGLADHLRRQRLGGLEAGALLRAVLANLDAVVLALDDRGHIQFANRAAERLLGRSAESLVGASAVEAGLEPLLRRQTSPIVEHAFPGGAGRWDVRRATFRQEGVPHQLLVLSDVGQMLRQEERGAWRRLIRVLSHEINNSLTPIQSISRGLLDVMRRDPPPPDFDDDLAQGLGVIAGRAEALGRFMTSYARLARLPPPRRRRVEVSELVHRAVRLETRRPIRLVGGPPVALDADSDQLEQVLINLLANASEAAAETGGGVEVGWSVDARFVRLWIRDDGPGIAAATSLFVPFFTTKPHGSGIGLVLSQQIAEAHGGRVELVDREDARGCEARLVLPLKPEGGNPATL
ncbi:sensor histidine kinase [Longimicrobium sp.]|uniref:sensor histidine kinase n=1 Tax=Longimicrobium sp. TaxID=2029185 RepID=UPI002EDB8247